MSSADRGPQRRTRQQEAVAEVLGRHDDFRSAQQIHDALRADAVSVGLATVYRTLQAMADRAEVDTLRSDAGEVLYRQCATAEHHHHLVCRRCGRTVEVTGPAVESWLEQLAGRYGFADVSHDLEIFGTCAVCADAPDTDR